MELDPFSAPGPPNREPLDCFRERRERLLDHLQDAVVVVGAAPELLASRDTDVPYRPDSDLYFLTGLEEPQSAAILTPFDSERRFTLFVRERDPEREVWSGARLGVDGARERFAADAVYPIGELSERLRELAAPARRIVYPFGHPAVEPLVLATLRDSRGSRARSGTGPAATEDLDVALGRMRRVKDDAELERIRTAARISAQGHLAAMRHVRPGMGEWEVEAVLEGAFRARGAAGPAFPSIVGAGANATVLHYVDNRSRIGEGELVLVDAGARWGMYCADISRTFPASGRFSEPQRALYQLVLDAEKAGIAAAVPGGTTQQMHQEVLRVLVPGLMRLGLLPEQDLEEALRSREYRRFFMHQTSHWLGIDVHDVGLYVEDGVPVTLQPGMVLTVEPGLYVPSDAQDVPPRFRGIGIRVEDDVVITADGNEVPTRGVPVEVEEIERLMSEARRTG